MRGNEIAAAIETLADEDDRIQVHRTLAVSSGCILVSM